MSVGTFSVASFLMLLVIEVCRARLAGPGTPRTPERGLTFVWCFSWGRFREVVASMTRLYSFFVIFVIFFWGDCSRGAAQATRCANSQDAPLSLLPFGGPPAAEL